jgi:hypothetical protein
MKALPNGLGGLDTKPRVFLGAGLIGYGTVVLALAVSAPAEPAQAQNHRLFGDSVGGVPDKAAQKGEFILPTQEQAETRHPALQRVARITHTRVGIAGDPLNVALVATEKQLVGSMLQAGWQPTDPITLRSCVRIAASTVFHRPYAKAPVSNLYVGKRKQDLAFEQGVKDVRSRHHVRFWITSELDERGRPLWIGAATYDTHIEISRATGLLTHHIAPDVDVERDKLIKDLDRVGKIGHFYWIDHFQKKWQGRNGGGNPYYTDGRLAVGVLGPTQETEGR